MSRPKEPLVSIVTPFYNTEQYLAECIESVFAQTYQNWEYILVNNCSTDGSAGIAQGYAEKDQRIRLIHNKDFLSQVQNYNHALRQISPDSEYCKIVQADDWIMHNCVSRMVETAEKNPSVGIVSSYYLTEKKVGNVGLPYRSEFLSGKQICKKQLLDGGFFFGTPTSLLFRAEIVRTRTPFYTEGHLYEDTEACYEILQDWDFGFVHEILTFTRTENESILSRMRYFDTGHLDKFIVVYRYGRSFLDAYEYERAFSRTKNDYLEYLVQNVFIGGGKAFWEYHKNGLATIGYRLNIRELRVHILRAVLDIGFNPKKTVGRIGSAYRQKKREKYPLTRRS